MTQRFNQRHVVRKDLVIIAIRRLLQVPRVKGCLIGMNRECNPDLRILVSQLQGRLPIRNLTPHRDERSDVDVPSPTKLLIKWHSESISPGDFTLVHGQVSVVVHHRVR